MNQQTLKGIDIDQGLLSLTIEPEDGVRRQPSKGLLKELLLHKAVLHHLHGHHEVAEDELEELVISVIRRLVAKAEGFHPVLIVKLRELP